MKKTDREDAEDAKKEEPMGLLVKDLRLSFSPGPLRDLCAAAVSPCEGLA